MNRGAATAYGMVPISLVGNPSSQSAFREIAGRVTGRHTKSGATSSANGTMRIWIVAGIRGDL